MTPAGGTPSRVRRWKSPKGSTVKGRKGDGGRSGRRNTSTIGPSHTIIMINYRSVIQRIRRRNARRIELFFFVPHPRFFSRSFFSREPPPSIPSPPSFVSGPIIACHFSDSIFRKMLIMRELDAFVRLFESIEARVLFELDYGREKTIIN